jgi:hypothetical protein
MTHLNKIVLSAGIDATEIMPVVNNAIGGIKDIANKAEEFSGVDSRGEKPRESGDFLNDLNISQQSGREQFSGFGLDPETYEQYTKELRKLGMSSRAIAAKFLQDIALIAGSSSTNIQSVFPVAKAIYSRNVYSPDRAVAILRTIGKYESMVPGLGLFDLARQAADGNYNPHKLSLIRFSLMGVPGSKGNMNESRDLQQAFDGINLPNSALGELLNSTNEAKQQMQSSRESVLMLAAKYKLIVDRNRNKHLNEIYKYMETNLPSWIKNDTLKIRTIIEGLSGVAELNAIKQTALDGIGWKGQTGLGNLPQQSANPLGFVDRGASSQRIKKTAQSVNTQSNTNNSVNNPIQSVNTELNQNTQPSAQNNTSVEENTQSANNGNDNIAKMGYENGVWDTNTANRVQQLQSAIANQKVNVDTNYANLIEMINAGISGQSQYSKETALNAPYATPEQIEQYAKSADKNAEALIKLILSLLTIFADVSKDANTSMSQNQNGMVQFSILMRNIESQFRSMLKDAQQIRIKIFDISVLGTIDQQVKLLEPTYQELKANMDMMASFNNVGADAFVMPFASITQQMASLYSEASKKYAQAASRIQSEPAMAQYCSQRSKQMAAASAKAKAEGVVALRNLMKQQGGSAVASTNEKFVRLSETSSQEEEKEDNLDVKNVEAKPQDVDDYWDDLYNNKPPYGDVIVNPEKYRNKPSWKFKRKHTIKRID